MSSSSSSLSVGLIGFGVAGSRFHAPLIGATPGLELTGIVTGDQGRQASAAARYPRAQLHPTVESLFDHADSLDLVIVATPNDSHVAYALRAVEAGIPVVVDKPIAASATDAAELVATARRRGVFLTVYQNRRWDGDFVTVRRLVEDGVIGDVHRFESRFETWSASVADSWKEDPRPEVAGGVLVDLGTHLVDQSVVLFGEVESVYAEIDRRRGAALVDDDSLISVRFCNGVRAHLGISKIAALPGPRFHVLGSKGAYLKYGLDVQENQLQAGRVPGDPSWGIDDPPATGTVSVGDRSTQEPVAPGAYESFYAGVVESLRDGKAVPVDPEDAVYTMYIIEAARRSAQERTPIGLPARRELVGASAAVSVSAEEHILGD
jgi:scyllo-inositol 2-dehydrogenase (NADP+)